MEKENDFEIIEKVEDTPGEKPEENNLTQRYEKLKKIQENSKNEFKKNLDLLEGKYDELAKNIEKKIQENGGTVSEELIHTYEKIMDTHNSLFDSVNLNLGIFTSFLESTLNLDKNKYNQDFIEKEFERIIKSWVFMKIDLGKFDFLNGLEKLDLNPNFKDFIIKECQGKNFRLKIALPKAILQDDSNKKQALTNEQMQEIKAQIDIGKKALLDNSTNLMSLKMVNIPDVNEFILTKKFEKAKTISFDNSSFSDIFNIAEQFPIIEKLTFKKCPKFDLYYLSNNLTHLTTLKLIKCNLNTEEFKILLETITYSAELLQNLEIINLSGNIINKADFNFYIDKPKNTMHSLRELDLHKNKLYKIAFSPDFFPKLKYVNCCENNFGKNYNFNFKEITFLQSENPFLLDDDLSKDYYTNLKKQLESENVYPINYLNISYIPEASSKLFLEKLIINPIGLNKIKKLNLTYNRINSETLIKFLVNNKGMPNLESLNLSGNYLDDTFFKEYLDNKLQLEFPSLKALNLSDNRIGCDGAFSYQDDEPIKYDKFKTEIYKLRLFYKFIYENKNLIRVNITKNPISDKYSVGMKPTSAKDCTTDLGLVVKSNNKIIINCLFSLLVKIKEELLKDESNKKRNTFNLRFDARSNINKYSDGYPLSERPILRKP